MIIASKKDFDLLHTFDCGQCFRWNIEADNSYTGVIYDHVINVSSNDENISISCDDENLVNDYFDLKRDYSKLKNALSKDLILKEAIGYGSGIRILKQQPWETLISFIISANNNIPRIKKIVEGLCQNFGNKLSYKGKLYYTFPSCEVVSKLTEDDLAVIKSGYRAGYILDAAKKISSGQVNLNEIYNMNEYEGRQALKEIKGVGDKVADCVLLFAYQKFSVFPKDVWIKRMLNNLYEVEEGGYDEFIIEKFGNLGGFAQQYLFFYGRDTHKNAK